MWRRIVQPGNAADAWGGTPSDDSSITNLSMVNYATDTGITTSFALAAGLISSPQEGPQLISSS